MNEPLLVTMDKAAFLLSLSRRTLDKMRLAGEIETTKIGSKRLVPMREVHRIADITPPSPSPNATTPRHAENA